MLTEADFERCAALMVKLHGANAAAHAHLRAMELRELGEKDAAEIWSQVSVMIERLLKDEGAHAIPDLGLAVA
jgi:hypothetical protein